MTWDLTLALRGDLKKYLDAELRAGKSAVSTTLRRRTTNLKNDLRRQVARAGMSKRLGNAIRADVYPYRKTSLNAKGVVRSAALTMYGGEINDLITLFDSGVTVFPRAGHQWIAIANPRVVQLGPGVKRRPRARSPSEFPKGAFIFRRTKKDNLALLVKKNEPDKVAFWLVKSARIKKTLDINSAYEKAVAGLDQAVVAAWEKGESKVSERFE